MSLENGNEGVFNCYAFKSRLQEYAQKVNFPTPVYETVKEGPSHEPVFKSTVIVNGVRYDSLAGFYNRKAAEQSAAEIALMEIQKAGSMMESMRKVHESGLCKNILQEYAQKMNHAIPTYTCNRPQVDKSSFTCTVNVGGIRYIGASAKTKKEAEIRAARTALLAIQSSSCGDETNSAQYTVIPVKKKNKELEGRSETVKHIKANKEVFKRKPKKRKHRRRNSRSTFNKNSRETLTGRGAPGAQDNEAEIFDHDKHDHEEESEVISPYWGRENIDSENDPNALSLFTLKSTDDFQRALPTHTNDGVKESN